MSVKKMSRAYLAVRPLENLLLPGRRRGGGRVAQGSGQLRGGDGGHECFSVRLRCTRYGMISTATMTSRITPTAAALE